MLPLAGLLLKNPVLEKLFISLLKHAGEMQSFEYFLSASINCSWVNTGLILKINLQE